MLDPLGGHLVNLLLLEKETLALQKQLSSAPAVTLSSRDFSDFELLVNGGFSPLTGFMDSKNYQSVLDKMTLVDGTPWTIPIILPISENIAKKIKKGTMIFLKNQKDLDLGALEVSEIFKRDLKEEAHKVYLTEDEAHPGVKALYAQSNFCVAGKISAFSLPKYSDFNEYRLTPMETRAKFASFGWKTIVAFQTRNPIHRAHEHIIKTALEVTDGLLLHPIVGATKDDDVPPDARIKCYEVLLEKYFPLTTVVLAVNPAAMRYAGPREAIFHAIVRRNYGCTHFIVGRDHAGVGNYYGTYDAHKIFNQIDKVKLGIIPLFFDHAFFCRRCEDMASKKTCPHAEEDHVHLSGTKVREMLLHGDIPPLEFTRPEIATILIEYYKEKQERESLKPL